MIVANELLRCERWTPEERGTGVFLVAMAASFTVLPLIVLSYIWWLLTGHGPLHRMGTMRGPFVSPFRIRIPPDVIDAIRRQAAAQTGGDGCDVPASMLAER